MGLDDVGWCLRWRGEMEREELGADKLGLCLCLVYGFGLD
jgi:hypothetical protein